MKKISLNGALINIVVAIVALVFSIDSSAQTSQNTNDGIDPYLWRNAWNKKAANVYELEASFLKYWSDKDVTKGKGYKPFMRWLEYTKPRVYPTGDITITSRTNENFKHWKKEVGYEESEQTSRAGNWKEVGPFAKATGADTGVGRINMLRFDPTDNNIMYVGAPDGGLWKSMDGGASWTTNTDFLSIIGVSDLAIDPNNKEIMYLATGDLESARLSIGVLKSTDGGVSWNTTGLVWTPADNYRISKLLMHPSNSQILLASTDGGVFRTTDGGATWSYPNDVFDFRDMEFKPGDPNTVYCAGTSFYKSTDNGVNFTEITSGLPTSNVTRHAIAVTAHDDAYVYLMAGRDDNNGLLGVYRSTDSGTNFSTVYEPDVPPTVVKPNLLGNELDGTDEAGQAFYCHSMVVSPVNKDIIIVGGVSQWRSTDGGSSWTISSFWDPQPMIEFVHADIHELIYEPGSMNTVYSCGDGGLSKSTDNGVTWTDISNNLAITQMNILGISTSDPDVMYAGLQDIGTIKKSGSVWTVVSGGDGEDCLIQAKDNNYVIVTGTNGMHEHSTDGGTTFNDIEGIPKGSGNALFFSPIREDSTSTDRLYAGGRDTMYVSNDWGNTWTSLGNPFGADKITEFSVSASSPSTIYATKGSELSKSIDSGSTWSDITGTLPLGSAMISKIGISNTSDQKVWVVLSGYSAGNKVFASTDGGSNWTNISTGLPNVPMNTIVHVKDSANDELYVGAEIGIFYFNSTLSEWLPYFNDLPNVAVKDLKIYYPTMKLRAATYGRGAWESDAYDASADCSALVVNTNDDGPGSLRRVIACASEGDTIKFDNALVGQTINLTAGPIRISKNLVIKQLVSTQMKIKANVTGPVFNISGSKSFWLEHVELFAGTNASGRALINSGNLTLKDVVIHENTPLGTSTISNLGNVNVIGSVELKKM